MLAYLGIVGPGAYPPHSVVLGNGTYALPGAAGTILGSNGASADPSFESLAALGIQPALGYTPAHSGANSDITSLSALSTALSIGQGGTGQTTAAAALAALGGQPAGTYAPLPLPANSVGSSQLVNGSIADIDVSATAAIQSSKLSYTLGVTGGVARAVNLRLDDWISAIGAGVTGNGSTDDSGTLQNVLNNSPAGSIVWLPPLTYRIASGITVPPGKALVGLSLGGSTAQNTSILMADLGVAVPVTIDGGAASGACALMAVTVTRAAGTIPAGSIGVVVQNTNESILQDVYSLRASIGYSIAGASQTNLGVRLLRCLSSQITDAHAVISNSVETTFDSCRFGRNGGADVACNAFVRISGPTVDTVRFPNSQFNQSGANANYVIQFVGYAGNPNGIFTFSECHMETWNGVVNCDATSTPTRLRFIACTINGSGPIYSGPAAALTEFMLTGNNINGGGTLTLDQHVQSVLSGNQIDSTILVNAGSQVIVGNSFAGAVTLQGAAVKTIFVGNAVGSLTNTMTGTFAVANNA
ncbi:glycosyl hydrolase family 28-related protein [Caballeronia udeis]